FVRLVDPVDVRSGVAVVIVGALKSDTFVDLQVNMTLQGHGAGEVDGFGATCAQPYSSSAAACAGVDGFLDCAGVVGSAIACRAEVQWITVCPGARRGKSKESKQQCCWETAQRIRLHNRSAYYPPMRWLDCRRAQPWPDLFGKVLSKHPWLVRPW